MQLKKMSNKRSLSGAVEEHLLAMLPKQKKIVFVNIWGRGYGDNPKYIAEEILRQGLPYDLVWLVGDMSLTFPEGIRKVKYYSLQSKYELATARIIISNAKGRLPYIKKKSQYYIQTWHGGFPLKYIEQEAEDDLAPDYRRDTIYDSSITDLLLSGSDFQTAIMEKSFWYNGEIFKKGVPRNDVFFNYTQEDVARHKRELGVDPDCRLAIYAPTFRDDFNSEAYTLDAPRLLQALRQRTGTPWKIIIRLHPSVAFQSDIFQYGPDIINGTALSDPQDILVAADLLITDYSSIMMDFGIMRKPVMLFCTDLEKYTHNCRNLRPIFYELPFRRCADNDELCQAVSTFDKVEYLAKLDDFLTRHYHSYDDGHASAHVVERIKEVVERSYD